MRNIEERTSFGNVNLFLCAGLELADFYYRLNIVGNQPVLSQTEEKISTKKQPPNSHSSGCFL